MKAICAQCKKVIYKAPSHLKRKNVFCNRDCYLKGIKNNLELTSNWKNRTFTFNCKVCSQICTKRMYSNGKPKYCSLKCAAIDRGFNQSGKNHWNWKGGNDTRYLKKIAPRPKPDRCESCNQYGKKRNGICLDHNHKTKKFRGWLCSNCNTALGLLNEDIDKFKALINYLQKNQ